MKILFTNPLSFERFNCIPDLGQGYLMALARAKGPEVRFLDCLLERCTYDDFEREVRAYSPDIVGLKVYSIDLDTAAEMLRRVKGISANIVTVIGGPHPSTELPERIFDQFPTVDYAFAGEAEVGFPAFLERLAANEASLDGIPGVIWRDGDGGVRTNDRVLVQNLDEVPFPAWDLMDPRKYRWGYSFMTSRFPAAPMVLTRGCPFLCTFCGSHLITGRHVRKRGLDNVMEEIGLLRRDYGVRSLDIVDENFVFDVEYATAFCERLLRDDIRLGWNCPYGVRLDRLTEPLVKLMARSGCYGLSVGIESGSDRILEMVKKRLTVEEIKAQTAMIKRASDIMVQGYFMMGFPTETREEIEMTIDLACSLPIDIAGFHPLRITPGTEIYTDLVQAGVIAPTMDYSGMGHHYFVRSYCPVPDDEMRRLYRKAYARFYGRPKVVLNLLRRIRSRAQLRTVANGIGRLIRKPASKFDPRKTNQGPPTDTR